MVVHACNPGLGTPRQMNYELMTCLGYIVRLFFKTKPNQTSFLNSRKLRVDRMLMTERAYVFTSGKVLFIWEKKGGQE